MRDIDTTDDTIWSGAHTRHQLRYHLVWVPKYRHRMLTGALAHRLEELLHQACEVHNWRIRALSVQPDHVHLLAQTWPDDRLSDVAQALKGGTSKALRQEFGHLDEFRWKAGLWGRGYYAATVGQVEEETVHQYIQAQQQLM